MTGQKPHDWQWDDSQWGNTPTTPTSPEQVPEDDDGRWAGWPAYLQRLMRWAKRTT